MSQIVMNDRNNIQGSYLTSRKIITWEAVNAHDIGST